MRVRDLREYLEGLPNAEVLAVQADKEDRR